PSSGRIVAGAWDREKKIFPGCAATMMRNPRSPAPVFQRNTTLGIIATNAELTKAQAKRIAMMAHDGLARTISPIHTMFDGDTIFCASSGRESADITAVGVMAAEVTARAVIKAVVGAEGRYGIPGYRDVTEK
ncbi:MAG: peptidase S58 family protein, partial [Spirochaetales bacterium]